MVEPWILQLLLLYQEREKFRPETKSNCSELCKLWTRNGIEADTNFGQGTSWNHCGSSDNLDDRTTKGEFAGKILLCSMWWSGPAWLCRPIHSWSCRDLQYSLEDICDTDKVVREQRSTQVNSMIANSGVENSPLLLLDANEFSELCRLLRLKAWVKRFAHNSKFDSIKLNGTICAPELNNVL
ncbi:integrase catalytic domain-containing protein [Nephila pilipes]|uniref:Integrase catalytic domain-containing protein n=1 Tax=Nephila pilipes TaxID=299642 RepID=A0A8X6KN65_NEPPI|nr:integrase catalytic domain-containing protein [Nephila pilipes]